MQRLMGKILNGERGNFPQRLKSLPHPASGSQLGPRKPRLLLGRFPITSCPRAKRSQGKVLLDLISLLRRLPITSCSQNRDHRGFTGCHLSPREISSHFLFPGQRSQGRLCRISSLCWGDFLSLPVPRTDMEVILDITSMLEDFPSLPVLGQRSQGRFYRLSSLCWGDFHLLLVPA